MKTQSEIWNLILVNFQQTNLIVIIQGIIIRKQIQFNQSLFYINDCWVSFFHQVFDLTQLLQENCTSELCDPILLNAGTDISHWFDPITREPKTFVDPEKGTTQFYCPTGRYLHISSPEPDSKFSEMQFVLPWWRDINKYMIGHLTVRTRKIRIINMLTKHEDVLEVATEETINEILDRYLELNLHSASYTWKRLGKVLDMDKTLAENEIPDETDELLELGMDLDDYIPAVHLYFNDDLTIA